MAIEKLVETPSSKTYHTTLDWVENVEFLKTLWLHSPTLPCPLIQFSIKCSSGPLSIPILCIEKGHRIEKMGGGKWMRETVSMLWNRDTVWSSLYSMYTVWISLAILFGIITKKYAWTNVECKKSQQTTFCSFKKNISLPVADQPQSLYSSDQDKWA